MLNRPFRVEVSVTEVSHQNESLRSMLEIGDLYVARRLARVCVPLTFDEQFAGRTLRPLVCRVIGLHLLPSLKVGPLLGGAPVGALDEFGSRNVGVVIHAPLSVIQSVNNFPQTDPEPFPNF